MLFKLFFIAAIYRCKLVAVRSSNLNFHGSNLIGPNKIQKNPKPASQGIIKMQNGANWKIRGQVPNPIGNFWFPIGAVRGGTFAHQAPDPTPENRQGEQMEK